MFKKNALKWLLEEKENSKCTFFVFKHSIIGYVCRESVSTKMYHMSSFFNEVTHSSSKIIDLDVIILLMDKCKFLDNSQTAKLHHFIWM